MTVKRVLVDEASDIQKEIYLGMVIDRARRRVVMMASSEGGIDIEEVAATNPEAIKTVLIDPVLGMRAYQAIGLASGIGLSQELCRSFIQIALGLYQAFTASDADAGRDQPAGGHRAMVSCWPSTARWCWTTTPFSGIPTWRKCATWTRKPRPRRKPGCNGLSYVKLDGEIGCMVNGAGLAMATMDMVKLYGGEPANFLDIGGGAQADKVAAALRIILRDPNVKAVLFNIFGGITRCDEVARGILDCPGRGADRTCRWWCGWWAPTRKKAAAILAERQHGHCRHAWPKPPRKRLQPPGELVNER